MKTLEENQKELQELQEYIDTITTTAKLLGHEVSTEIMVSIRKKGEIIPFMKIDLRRTFNTTWLKTNYKTITTLRGNIPHEVKLSHLKQLLQEL